MIVSQIQLCHKETIIQARSLKINSLLPTSRLSGFNYADLCNSSIKIKSAGIRERREKTKIVIGRR